MSTGKVLGVLIASVVGVLVLAAVVVAVLVSRGDGLAVRSPFEAGEAALQISALRTKLSTAAPAVSVVIDAEKITIELQDPAIPLVTDEWTISHTIGLNGLIDWTELSGPHPVQSNGQGLAVKDRTFDLAQIDFSAVPAIAKAAIDRVALEEQAAVKSMELSKPHILIPVEQAGPLRWLIHVASPHETAEAYADPAGRLTGVDLSHTLRAQNLDLFEGGQPLLEMVREIDVAFDYKEQIDQIIVYRNLIGFRLVGTGPGESAGRYKYVSDINGLHRDAIGEMTAVSIPAPPGAPVEQPVSAKDIGWAAMPRLVEAARQVLVMPAATVAWLKIRRIAHGLEAPAIEWEFDLQSADGRTTDVTLDSDGKPLRALPGKAGNLLDAAAIERLLGALRANAGDHAAVMELRVTTTNALVDLRDPRKPETLVSLVYDGSALDVFPGLSERPGRWRGLPYGDDWLFDLGAIDVQVLQDLPARESAAIAELKIPGGKVTGLIFGRQRLMFPNNRELVVEVDVTGDGKSDGRVFFDPRGKVLRSDSP